MTSAGGNGDAYINDALFVSYFETMQESALNKFLMCLDKKLQERIADFSKDIDLMAEVFKKALSEGSVEKNENNP